MQKEEEGNRRIKIYSDYLQELKGIKFTLREIDIIACILHNRGEKKIAAMLAISHRTVSSHMRNIMGKLGCNTRDLIIDVIEKSGKLKYLRQYYFHLLADTLFKRYLNKIGTLVSYSTIDCYVDLDTASDSREQEILKFITETLSFANVKLKILSKFQAEKAQIRIYFINKGLTDSMKNNYHKNVALLVDDTTGRMVNEEELEYISFTAEADHYQAIFKLLQKIITNPFVAKITTEFDEEYKALQSSLEEKISGPTKDIEHSKIKFSREVLRIAIIALICCSYFVIRYNTKINQKNHKRLATETAIFEDTDKLLAKYFQDFSVRNLLKEEAEQNYKVISQLKPVIEQIVTDKAPPFNYSTVKPAELINSLYNLNATASYFLFKEHDTEKAEKILQYSKKMAEDYVLSRSKVPINFNNLTPAETYTEFAINQDLPEMYTITIYFLGRSNIYKKNIDQAEKYFKLSRYLGHKLGLFEEVLSLINGLGIIKGDRIEQLIKNKEYEKAKLESLECIKIYKQVRKDNKEYKKNYHPNNQNPATIIPAEDIYNILDCSKRIIKLYTRLITLAANNKFEQEAYAKQAFKHFTENGTSYDIFNILIKSGDQLNRIAADFYNNLGYFLLKLHEENIDFHALASMLTKKLDFTNNEELKVINQIFELARSLSRNNEFAKADAYDGLAKVHELMIKRNDYSNEEKKELTIKIEEFKNMRDTINKALKR